MIKRILRRAKKGSLDGSVIVGAGIALSRLSGLFREIVLAAFLGSGPALEAFTAAFRIPNTMQNLLGEGVLSASFIPSYSQLLAKGDTKRAGQLASTILLSLIGIVSLIVSLCVVLAPQLTDVIASGYSGERRELTIRLIQITSPGIGLLVISSWCLGILNSHKQFFLSYVAPVLWNFAQIVGVSAFGLTLYKGASGNLDFSSIELVKILGWSSVVGSLLQLLIQLPSVLKFERNISFQMIFNHEARFVFKKFLPVVGARGVIQLSAWVDLLLASFLATGAVASLRYAQFLYILPISLFGMSIAAAELPEMSIAKLDTLLVRLNKSATRVTFLVLPIAAAYLVCGDYIIGTLFARGEFSSRDAFITWLVLAAMSIGLLGATLSRLLQSALYALNDTKIPAESAITRVFTAFALGAFFMFPLERVGFSGSGFEVLGSLSSFFPLDEITRETPNLPRLGAIGLGFSASIGAWVEFFILYDALTERLGKFKLISYWKQIFFATMLCALAAICCKIFLNTMPFWRLSLVTALIAGPTYIFSVIYLGVDLRKILGNKR